MKPLLVDSSAWIQSFSKHPEAFITDKILTAKKNKCLTTCGMVYLEVLRGSRNKEEWKELSEEFQAMVWMPVEDHHWHLASQMGFQLLRKGLKPPATDLLIAAVAIQEGCQLLHKDKHFVQIAQYFPLRHMDSSLRSE